MLGFIFDETLMFVFQDIAVGSYVRIRGLEVNGIPAVLRMPNINVSHEH